MPTQISTTGTVTSFNARRGYGFINSANGENVFVHQNDIKMDGFRHLNVGEEVKFEIEDTDDGKFKAVNVELISIRENKPRNTKRPTRGNSVEDRLKNLETRFDRLLHILAAEMSDGGSVITQEELEEVNQH